MPEVFVNNPNPSSPPNNDGVWILIAILCVMFIIGGLLLYHFSGTFPVTIPVDVPVQVHPIPSPTL